MLAENTRSWTHQWKMAGVQEGREQGRKEGRKTGRQEGLQEGEALLLQRQLAQKFGPLSESVQQRLKTASSAELEAWSLNILDATSLEQVFGG